MAKVMLVEDDNNLREIYEARLLAEGYEIVSAQDGEEALALAVKERPDLIIADVMMPKISGFDMLDILRTTAETKDTKVIMMTALSQAEDKARAAKLGADRYLVKSQVTLEDVARVAREVLEGTSTPSASADSSSAPGNMSADPPQAATTPVAQPPTTDDNTVATTPSADPPTPSPKVDAEAADASAQQLSEPIKTETSQVDSQIDGFAQTPAAAATTPASPASAPDASNEKIIDDAVATMSGETPAQSPTKPRSISVSTESSSVIAGNQEQPKTSVHTRIIKPINDITKAGTNLQELVAKEEAKEQAAKTTTDAQKIVVNDLSKDKKSEAAPSQPAVDPNSIAL